MGEGLSKKLSPNLLKGAVAAVAIGSVAVPAVEVDAASPITAAADGEKPTVDTGSQAIYRAAVQVDNTEAVAIIDARRKPSHRHKKPRLKFTGYEVQGQTSTFGWPTDNYYSGTADGHSNTNDPCIAIRNDSTLDHKFQLTVLYHHKKYQDITYQCDYGPGIQSRAVDITGKEVLRLHLNPYNYPTDHAWGIARELKGPKVR